jgi:short-subunit dehydrogenase
MNFKGKIIWITGASSGIGEALALQWAEHESLLILSGRNEDKLQSVSDVCKKKGAECMVIPLDLTSEESIRSGAGIFFAKYPYVDILVNNGGISQRSLAYETSVEIDRKIMETNFFGAVAMTKAVLPSMMERKNGHIVTISSVVGKFGFPLRTAYSASKHALQGYFDSLRAELTKYNIQVTIVSPGRIKTNISINAINKDGHKHGIMDPGQAKGISAKKCAEIIISAVHKGKKDIIIAHKERWMIFFRKVLPSIYYQLASKVSAT